jgi:hypothetical protein
MKISKQERKSVRERLKNGTWDAISAGSLLEDLLDTLDAKDDALLSGYLMMRRSKRLSK